MENPKNPWDKHTSWDNDPLGKPKNVKQRIEEEHKQRQIAQLLSKTFGDDEERFKHKAPDLDNIMDGIIKGL